MIDTSEIRMHRDYPQSTAAALRAQSVGGAGHGHRRLAGRVRGRAGRGVVLRACGARSLLAAAGVVDRRESFRGFTHDTPNHSNGVTYLYDRFGDAGAATGQSTKTRAASHRLLAAAG